MRAVNPTVRSFQNRTSSVVTLVAVAPVQLAVPLVRRLTGCHKSRICAVGRGAGHEFGPRQRWRVGGLQCGPVSGAGESHGGGDPEDPTADHGAAAAPAFTGCPTRPPPWPSPSPASSR